VVEGTRSSFGLELVDNVKEEGNAKEVEWLVDQRKVGIINTLWMLQFKVLEGHASLLTFVATVGCDFPVAAHSRMCFSKRKCYLNRVFGLSEFQ
jgi:hypothetical protein